MSSKHRNPSSKENSPYVFAILFYAIP
ncbi:hypothetical protein J009_04247 [Cryptococcus neoformans]|nr:hypothetical protein C350_04216 [Cryptococcus neoformans var. grubii MW-RSA36]OXG84232.1 hypothetical protein C350_02083 [Cryptococcus neoformans var. grubii MW-RSA36]OXH28913.1 hypothetical protein J009_04247 [Cryptococcus neoformans var. grubii]